MERESLFGLLVWNSILWYNGMEFFRIGCISKGRNCSFERIFRQIKWKIRRLSSAKSRIWNADMAEKTPKLHFREFRNTP